MSKKLLEESTVRSFMKLANLQPLTQKFITEKFTVNEKGDLEEEVQEESAPPDTDETAKSRGRLEEEELEEGEGTLEEEVVEEEADLQEEGKESEGRPASPKQKVKGAAKPTKVKGAHADHKMKPLKAGTHHSDKADSVEAGPTPKNPKNNSQFEIVTESLEEMEEPTDMGEEMDSPEGGEMGGGAESGPHKDKMKELIRGMLNSLKDMGAEYGMSMEISDEGAGGEPEAPEVPEPEAPMGDKGDEMMQEKLDEMVEKLTKRVAARLVKESKKKR